MLTDMIGSGRMIDVILALVVLEAAALLVWRRAKGPPYLRDLAANLVAGAMLLLALRAALTDAGAAAVALWLFLALLAHIADLVQRLYRKTAR